MTSGYGGLNRRFFFIDQAPFYNTPPWAARIAVRAPEAAEDCQYTITHSGNACRSFFIPSGVTCVSPR